MAEIHRPGAIFLPLIVCVAIYTASSRKKLYGVRWRVSVVQSLKVIEICINPLIATLKPKSNEPSYSNTVMGTLAVDGWAVTFETVRRSLGGAAARPDSSSLFQM